MGSIKDPIFGIVEKRLCEINKNIPPGTEEGESLRSYNRGFDEFITIIVSGQIEKPAVDDVDKIMSIRAMHDDCYYLKPSEDVDPSLVSVSMKNAFNLYGEGSLLDGYIEEYLSNEILKYTGLNLNEWLNLPEIHQRVLIRNIGKLRKYLASGDEEAKNLAEQLKKVSTDTIDKK